MGIRINTNVVSLSVARRLGQTNTALERSYARLASGLRIATAADDPAGVGIAGRMRAEVRSLAVARRNAQDGISLLQVAEGALTELTDIFHRTRELAIQASNGTLSATDREVIELERTELAEEATRLMESTTFNGISLFEGGSDFQSGGIAIQVGTTRGETIDLMVSDTSRASDALNSIHFRNQRRATRSLEPLDLSLEVISRARGQIGALQNRMASAGRTIATRSETSSASLSRIEDLDFAMETAELTRLQILQESGVMVLAQANLMPMVALDLIRQAVPGR